MGSQVGWWMRGLLHQPIRQSSTSRTEAFTLQWMKGSSIHSAAVVPPWNVQMKQHPGGLNPAPHWVMSAEGQTAWFGRNGLAGQHHGPLADQEGPTDQRFSTSLLYRPQFNRKIHICLKKALKPERMEGRCLSGEVVNVVHLKCFQGLPIIFKRTILHLPSNIVSSCIM